jgi:hypothetical protein
VDAVYSVKNAAFAATAGAKTVLNVIAGANQPVSIIEWGVSFDGVTASAVPATVELCQSTQAGAGTPGSTPTIVQVGGRAITAQPTAGSNYAAEPTTLTAIEGLYVPQFMGVFVKQYPLGQEPDTDLSGGTVKALCIRVNVTANVNVLAYIRFSIGG